MLHCGGAGREFEEAVGTQDKDLEEGILRAVAEDVPIKSLRRDPLIKRSAPIVVDEQPVARVLGKARLHEALGLAPDEVEHRFNPVALDGVSHAGQYPCLTFRDPLDFGPEAPRVVHAIAGNEAEAVGPHVFGICIDPGFVFWHGLDNLDPDAAGWHRHDEIGSVSRLHAQRKIEEAGPLDGSEEAAGNPGFGQRRGSAPRSARNSNVVGSQSVAQFG